MLAAVNMPLYIFFFYCEGLLPRRPPQNLGPPLVGCQRLFVYSRLVCISEDRVFYPQPEGVLCCGDRNTPHVA